MPNYDSVVDGAKIVDTAIKAFGRVDIVVNNAGILRDVSFHKLTDKDWNLLNQVHLRGSYAVTKAAWPVCYSLLYFFLFHPHLSFLSPSISLALSPTHITPPLPLSHSQQHMRKNGYGRVIFVTSAAGIYGNFGQSHYSAVKMALLGFSNTLAKEGSRKNIVVNTIAPVAGSRMTETVMPPDMVNALRPDFVSPLVMYLTHDTNKSTGGVYELGAGWVSKLRWERSKGGFFPLSDKFTIESIRDNLDTINDFTDSSFPTTANEAFGPIMQNLEGGAPSSSPSSSSSSSSKGKSDKVDVAQALSYKFPPADFNYTERDAILYALGIGAAADQMDDKELKFTYENHPEFQVFPTFGVVAPSGAMGAVMTVPGLKFNPMMLLHGEQYMELKKPFLPSDNLTNVAKISSIYDKGSGALVLLDVESKNSKGETVIFNRSSLFIRGLGGFGGDKGPKAKSFNPPSRAPDVVQRELILDNQALLYRLSGDYNPLHADPAMAKTGGFDKPILHGLCSFGYAARAVVRHFCDNDASKFKSISARFAKHVFPGETIITEMWQTSPTQIIFRCKIAERGVYVLKNAVIELHGPKKAAGGAAGGQAASSNRGDFKATALFDQMKAHVSSDLVKKVGASFRFDLTSDKGTTNSWRVDLKTGNGSVEESSAKADCIFTMKDGDFISLSTGKLNPQSAFMKGLVKIKGNIMLAQKLQALFDTLKNAGPAKSAVSAAPAAGGDDFKATAVFADLKKRVNADTVKKVGASFRFDLTSASGAKKSWRMDLKNGNGSVEESSDKADCIFVMKDGDFIKLMSGKLNAQSAFMKGLVKIKGNLMLAQKLDVLMKAQSSL